jgi:hypothetical protein
MEATLRINTSTPAGIKLIRDLGTKKYVKIEEPFSSAIKESDITMDALFKEAEDFLNAHYGSNLKI